MAVDTLEIDSSLQSLWLQLSGWLVTSASRAAMPRFLDLFGGWFWKEPASWPWEETDGWFWEEPVELEDEKHSMIPLRYRTANNNFSVHWSECLFVMNFINQCAAQHVCKRTCIRKRHGWLSMSSIRQTAISIAQQIHKYRPYNSWFYVRWNELCMQVYKKIYSPAV